MSGPPGSDLSARWPFRRLIWLIPAAYAIHICEEYGAGFPAWVSHTVGGAMTGPGFLLNNAGFMALLVALTAWTSLRPRPLPAFLLLAWSSGQMFWNFVFHLATTTLYDRYSPGLVTATLLYFPLSLLVWGAAWRERPVGRPALALAILIGAALMALVIWAGLFHFAT